MDKLEAVLAMELSARHGVTTRKRLMANGVSRGVIDRVVRNGRLRHVGKGVLVAPSHPATFEQRLVIACALTGGVVTFPSAGGVWHFRKTPRSDRVHIATVQERRISVPDWIVVHRTSSLTRGDIVRRADGIIVTSPPYTAFDAASVLAPDDLESLIEQGLDRENFTLVTLQALARRVCARGRPGSRRFAEVLARREAWQRPADSDHELRLERALRRRGFPPLIRQFALEVAPGMFIRPDLAIPDHGFYVEVDHTTWHARGERSVTDRRRDLKVDALGYHVERVTDVALDHHLDETVEDLWAIWQRILGASGSESVLDAPMNKRNHD